MMATRQERDNGLKVLLENRTLLLFTTAITLFHFANAAMLPLVGEKLSKATSNEQPLRGVLHHRRPDGDDPDGHAGRTQRRTHLGTQADLSRVLRRLPIEAFSTPEQNPYALVAVQGCSMGGRGNLRRIVLHRRRGSDQRHRRYIPGAGASGACWGLGAALSNGVAGFMVNAFGYSTAFLFLSACALAAVLVFAWACRKRGHGNRGNA